MITTIEDLYKLDNNPRINDISLILLANFYKNYLNPYSYQYKIVDNSTEETKEYEIELRFDTENFCHLLAIEKIVERVKNTEEIKEFKAEAGWNNVLDEIITIPMLKAPPTKGVFKNNKDKYVFFLLTT